MKNLNGKAIVITGPVASGKTTLAKTLAEALGSVSYADFSSFLRDDAFAIGSTLAEERNTVVLEGCTFDTAGQSTMKALTFCTKFTVNQMCQHPRQVDAPNFIFVSQDSAPLDFGKESRRFLHIDLSIAKGPVDLPQDFIERLSSTPAPLPSAAKPFAIGATVLVHDRYRFAVPLLAEVLRHASNNDGVKLRLIESNSVKYPIGTFIWVSEKQISDAPEPPKEKPKFRSYWSCVVAVDVPEGEMPRGADSPVRSAVESAVSGLHPEAEVRYVASGWGLNAKGAECVQQESCLRENNISNEDRYKRDGK